MTATRTAAEALEYLRRKVEGQPDLAQITVSARDLRAALAQPQEGEVEECARYCEDAAETSDINGGHPEYGAKLRSAARLLRATQSNGHSPPSTAGNTVGQAGLTVGPNFDGESPAQSAPAQPVTMLAELNRHIEALEAKGIGAVSSLESARNARADLLARYAAPPPAPAQEPVAWQDVHDNTDLYYRKPPQGDVRPLYAAPPPAPTQEPVSDALRAFASKNPLAAPPPAPAPAVVQSGNPPGPPRKPA